MPLATQINRSAPCLPAHQVRFRWVAVIFKALFFICLHDVYLYDVLQIANLEPGVSGRNSLPLPGTLQQGLLLVSALFMPLDFCIEFCIDFRVDFGPYFGPKFVYFSMIFLNRFSSSVFGVIIDVFLSFVCTSDVLKSRFYCRKTAIFKVLHAFSKL